VPNVEPSWVKFGQTRDLDPTGLLRQREQGRQRLGRKFGIDGVGLQSPREDVRIKRIGGRTERVRDDPTITSSIEFYHGELTIPPTTVVVATGTR
jgi:hypothetical protein